MKNLLIGNGLNLTNEEENSFLKAKDIYDRFLKNLEDYWDIINKLLYQSEINLEKIIKELNTESGIEKNAGKIFEYIHNEIMLKKGEFIRNYSYRLIEILGEISIKSIFFKDNKFLIPQITDEYKNKIEQNYDNIFTLNYIEDWDKIGKVKYLHGNLIKYVDKYSDIGSLLLSNILEYSEFKTKEYIKINFKDIVFMPINTIISKSDFIVDGLKLGNDLRVGPEAVLYSGRDIYNVLDGLDNITVFGMSPEGDEAIINKIKNIKNKKIYVHELKKDEINKWKSYGIEDCFINSEEFLK